MRCCPYPLPDDRSLQGLITARQEPRPTGDSGHRSATGEDQGGGHLRPTQGWAELRSAHFSRRRTMDSALTAGADKPVLNARPVLLNARSTLLNVRRAHLNNRPATLNAHPMHLNAHLTMLNARTSVLNACPTHLNDHPTRLNVCTTPLNVRTTRLNVCKTHLNDYSATLPPGQCLKTGHSVHFWHQLHWVNSHDQECQMESGVTNPCAMEGRRTAARRHARRWLPSIQEYRLLAPLAWTLSRVANTFCNRTPKRQTFFS